MGIAYIDGNDYKTRFSAVNAYVILFRTDGRCSLSAYSWIEKLNERPAVKNIAVDHAAVQPAA